MLTIKKNSNVLSRVRIIFVFLLSSLFLLFPKVVYSFTLSSPSSVPSSVFIEQSFSVNGELGDVETGQQYFIKCRIGQSESNLTEGQTYNADSGLWFSDSGAWVDMPTLQVTALPTSFSVPCRVKAGVISGQKIIYLRACQKESGGNCGTIIQSSIGTNFMVIDSPSPTPTATLTPIPTAVPPTATLTPTPTQPPSSYSNIYLSEFLAYPESGNEWVELYNGNDSEANLSGWFIDDIAGGGKSPKMISEKIGGKSYKRIFLDDFFLNNEGDDVRLLDGSQNEKDKKSYSSSIKGKSWSKDSNGNWCETDPTPEAANPGCLTATITSVPTASPALNPTPTEVEISPVEFSLLKNQEDYLDQQRGKVTPVILGAQITPTKTPVAKDNKGKFKIAAGIFVFAGLVLLGLSGYFLIKENRSQKPKIDFS